ncbi:MAG: hypothetical protein ACI3YD_06350, partial [Alloprevotella sp.]
MKKVSSLLFLLLLLCGAGSAQAQRWVRGNLLDDMDDIVGKPVLMYSPGTSDDHPAGFFNGNQAITEGVGESNMVIFEEVEGKTVDDVYPVYRLKLAESGLYIKDYDIKGDDYYFDGVPEELTDNPAEAFEFTCLLGYEDAENDRELATPQKQDMSLTGFVLMRAKVSP